MPVQTTATRYHPSFSYYLNDEVIGQSLGLYGEYAEPEIDFLRQFMGPGTVVYDVGANIGVHTRAFASTGARIWAWEPNPDNFNLLKANCSDLDRVQLINSAVGNQTGTTTITGFDPMMPGNYGHLVTGSGGTPCDIVRLDDINAPDPDIIKIDVEGHEFAVMLGAVTRIRRRKPIVYYEAQETADFGQIYHFFRTLDYSLYWCTIMNYNANNFRQNSDNIFGNTAIFCILAAPPGMAPMPLDPVLNAAESWQIYCDRVNAARA